MKPYSDVIDDIRRLATENTDRVSDDTYFDDWSTGTPGCIFGHVIAKLGARPMREYDGPHGGEATVVNADGEPVAVGYQSAGGIHWNLLGVETPTVEESLWSDYLQGMQDNGEPWGRALELADEYHPSIAK